MDNATRKDGLMTRVEIAQSLGISRSLVEQIERKALRKLRKILEQRGYRFDDFLIETRG